MSSDGLGSDGAAAAGSADTTELGSSPTSLNASALSVSSLSVSTSMMHTSTSSHSQGGTTPAHVHGHVAYTETAQEMMEEFSNFQLLKPTFQLRYLHTKIRNRETPTDEFRFYADRLISALIEQGLSMLEFKPHEVHTPTDSVFSGLAFDSRVCGVSIVRSGEAMERGLREVCKTVRIGKLLIRQEGGVRQLVFCRLPRAIGEKFVLLLDPIVGTGGTLECAIQALIDAGVRQDKILLFNLIVAPQGVRNVLRKYPEVRMLASEVDERVNSKKEVVPGIGNFADRYFGMHRTVVLSPTAADTPTAAAAELSAA